MELFELDLKQLLEVKLLRLNKPKFNSQSQSINGIYSSLNDLNSLSLLPHGKKLENKLKEFNLCDENSPNSENMLVNNPSFGYNF